MAEAQSEADAQAVAVRSAAVLVTRTLFKHLSGRPTGDVLAALSLAMGGVISVIPPDQRQAVRNGVIAQIDDAVAAMVKNDAVETG